MEISDQDLLGVFETAEAQGHPDPLGLIARSQVITNLDGSFATKDRFGISGIRQADIERVGIGDASDPAANLAAAIKVDIDNFRNFNDVGNMHVAFHSGGEAVADRSKRPKKFMRELSKAKVSLDKRIKKLQSEKPKKPAEPQVSVNIPEIQQARTASSLIPDAGDASKIQQVRLNSQNFRPTERSIPKRKMSETKSKLRSIIREALRSA